MITRTTPWLFTARSHPSARMRLFCFPHAGGGASMFRPWINRFPADIEVCPVQLPGRENRLGEVALTDFHTLAKAMAEALAPYLIKPFAFFGHSMGAMVGFELARLLRRRNAPLPEQLFISAYRAPQLPTPEPLLHRLPDSKLVEELLRIEPNNRAVLENAELRQFLLPIIRADFTACETYIYAQEDPLPRPITVFGGLQDNRVTADELEAWRPHTSSSFTRHMLPGGHFYLQATPGPLFKMIADEIRPYMR